MRFFKLQKVEKVFKNSSNLPLPIAVWLASSEYDFEGSSEAISATGMLKPLRSTILSQRVQQEANRDLLDMADSRIGTAIHDAVERSFMENYKKILVEDFGYKNYLNERIFTDPNKILNKLKGEIGIYLELRSNKEIDGVTISGKFDFVIEGVVHDIKTVKAYSYMSNSNVKNYILQGSMYKWLNPTIITEDYMKIVYIFMDWAAMQAQANPQYPQTKILVLCYPLLSLEETENYIKRWISDYIRFKDSPQEELPYCSPEDLWEDPAVYAYYKDKTKLTRATKKYDTMAEAMSANAANNFKGKVVKRDGIVKRCAKYCAAVGICSQAEQYRLEGRLK